MHVRLLQQKLANTKEHFTQPHDSTMKISPEEYREFLSNVGFTMNTMKSWLNKEIFKGGIPFPYNINEIDTLIKFNTGSMNIFEQVEENAQQFFEDEFVEEPKEKGDDAKGKKDNSDKDSKDHTPKEEGKDEDPD